MNWSQLIPVTNFFTLSKSAPELQDVASTDTSRTASPEPDHGSIQRKFKSPAAVYQPEESTEGPIQRRQLEALQMLMMDRLSERQLPSAWMSTEEHNHPESIYLLLEAAIQRRESNSILLIGPRGTGKSTALRMALEKARETFQHSPPERSAFIQITLNGLVHVNDRAALAEMVRQLQFQDEIDFDQNLSFADCFRQVFRLLSHEGRSRLPVVVILDEFDQFGEHNKQALLYNLFDTVQSSSHALTVIGLTCRQDALDALEKRVKSRFSHRVLYFYPPPTVEMYRQMVHHVLKVDAKQSPWLTTEQRAAYNASVQELITSAGFVHHSQRLFDIDRNVRPCFKVLMKAVMCMRTEKPQLALTDILDEANNQRMDSKTELLKDLSLLELCLVIAMKHLVELDTYIFNFAMVYDVYNDFATLHAGGYKKTVALKAFEHLADLEIVCAVDGVTKCPKEFRMFKVLLEPGQIADAVLRSNAPYHVKRWGSA